MTIKLFTAEFKAAWVLTAAFLAAAELTPFHSEGVSPKIFWAWQALKGLLFLAIGWQTPLTFWRFDSVWNGLNLACLSAAAIEAFQNLVVGHRFSIIELSAKIALICLGFITGLSPRHDERIGFGSITVNLITKHGGTLN